jgi:hypothetical protein
MTEVEKFMELRDKAIEGLSICDVLLSESEILELGYESVDFGGALTSNNEYEFTVYSKGGKKIVFVQTYEEREGGLYFQSLFSDKDTADEMEKPLVEASVKKPSINLLETILHFRGANIPGTTMLFSDKSIYQGCHHFATIANAKNLADEAINNFKRLVSESVNARQMNDEQTKEIMIALESAM